LALHRELAMLCVNEWKSPEWIPLHWDSADLGKVPKGPSAVRRPPDLEDAITDALGSLRPRPPNAVHFYLGEGLRWIRIGFLNETKLQPADVGKIGRAVAGCVKRGEGPLYFHALRPHDLLFFLKGGRPDKVGMSAEAFGVPLDEMLHAWNLIKASPTRHIRSDSS
jgi:hypothetical protein